MIIFTCEQFNLQCTEWKKVFNLFSLDRMFSNKILNLLKFNVSFLYIIPSFFNFNSSLSFVNCTNAGIWISEIIIREKAFCISCLKWEKIKNCKQVSYFVWDIVDEWLNCSLRFDIFSIHFSRGGWLKAICLWFVLQDTHYLHMRERQSTLKLIGMVSILFWL